MLYSNVLIPITVIRVFSYEKSLYQEANGVWPVSNAIFLWEVW